MERMLAGAATRRHADVAAPVQGGDPDGAGRALTRDLAGLDVAVLMINGAKALATGVKRVFGRRTLVQRRFLYKRRNGASYLPDELARVTDRKLAAAFNDTDPARGKRVVEGIARHLEAKHPPPRRACARASTTCSPCAASESAKVARDRTGTAAENRFAEAIETVPKLVFSRTLDSVGWNGHVASSPPEEEVRRLRGGGGRFLVQASPGLAADLRAAGLIDRCRLLLQPLVAGRPAMFATDEVVTVSLEAAVAFQSGAVALDYAVR